MGVPQMRTLDSGLETERIRASCMAAEVTGESIHMSRALEALETLLRYFETPVRGLWRDRLNNRRLFHRRTGACQFVLSYRWRSTRAPAERMTCQSRRISGHILAAAFLAVSSSCFRPSPGCVPDWLWFLETGHEQVFLRTLNTRIAAWRGDVHSWCSACCP